MSLISKIICSLYKNDRKNMINICLNFVTSFQDINDEKGIRKGNVFEIYFFIMFIVIRRYFRKRNKIIAGNQVNMFIKELYYYIWLTYINNNREIATQMFDLSTFGLVEKMNMGYLLKEMSLENALEEMSMGNIFEIITKKLTERIEYYSYSMLSDIYNDSYKETVNSLIDLTFNFKLNDSDSESLRLILSNEISNTINITEKYI
jgi:hypothetical protein